MCTSCRQPHTHMHRMHTVNSQHRNESIQKRCKKDDETKTRKDTNNERKMRKKPPPWVSFIFIIFSQFFFFLFIIVVVVVVFSGKHTHTLAIVFAHHTEVIIEKRSKWNDRLLCVKERWEKLPRVCRARIWNPSSATMHGTLIKLNGHELHLVVLFLVCEWREKAIDHRVVATKKGIKVFPFRILYTRAERTRSYRFRGVDGSRPERRNQNIHTLQWSIYRVSRSTQKILSAATITQWTQIYLWLLWATQSTNLEKSRRKNENFSCIVMAIRPCRCVMMTNIVWTQHSSCCSNIESDYNCIFALIFLYANSMRRVSELLVSKAAGTWRQCTTLCMNRRKEASIDVNLMLSPRHSFALQLHNSNSMNNSKYWLIIVGANTSTPILYTRSMSRKSLTHATRMHRPTTQHTQSCLREWNKKIEIADFSHFIGIIITRRRVETTMISSLLTRSHTHVELPPEKWTIKYLQGEQNERKNDVKIYDKFPQFQTNPESSIRYFTFSIFLFHSFICLHFASLSTSPNQPTNESNRIVLYHSLHSLV